tara:strand:+ start:916 stop:1038 length:123 start_codon:yes stop_codon:yes gene_type:complete
MFENDKKTKNTNTIKSPAKILNFELKSISENMDMSPLIFF